MNKVIYVLLFTLMSSSVCGGSISIEKSDLLIRNELFDEKKARAQEYKQYEAQRNTDNQYWTSQLDPRCSLLKNRYLLYFCASSHHYYKGYESGNKLQYRQLSELEVKKIVNEND